MAAPCPICGSTLKEVEKDRYICPNYPNHPPAPDLPIQVTKSGPTFMCPQCGKVMSRDKTIFVGNDSRPYIVCEHCLKTIRFEYVPKLNNRAAQGTGDFKCPQCLQMVNFMYGKCPNCGYIEGQEVFVPLQKVFPSGAKRVEVDTPAYSYIPICALRRLANVYKEGEQRYPGFNWRKGLPVSNIIDHALEHLNKWLEGNRTEDHLAKVAWAMFSLMYYEHNNILEDDVQWQPTIS